MYGTDDDETPAGLAPGTAEHVLEHVADGFFALDHRWRYTYVNAAAERAAGVRRGQLLGRRLWDVFPQALGTDFESNCRRALAAQAAVEFEALLPPQGARCSVRAFPTPQGLSVLFRHVHTGGREAGVEGEERGRPPEAGEGESESKGGSESERKETDRALRESWARLALALDAGQAGLAGWDARTRRLWWNERMYEILGYEDHAFEPDHRAWHSRVHPQDVGRVEEAVGPWLQQQRRRDYFDEFRIVWPGGEVRWVRCTGRCEYAPDGSVASISGIAIDVTALKRAEEEMRRAKEEAEAANRAKDEFLATVSHELRTPLGAMLLWTKLLRDGKLKAAERASALDVIEGCADEQSRLVEDLVDATRILHGKVRAEMGPTNLAGVVAAAAAAIRPAAEAKGVELTLSLPDAPVVGDPFLLQRVASNLLTNAVKFTPAGGHVEVRLAREEAGVRLQVIDEGEGIDPTFLPHLFDRFAQADRSSTRRHGGLGLGMSIVHHLVGLHGGRVEAQSEGIGRGATFTVTLPPPPPAGREQQQDQRGDGADPSRAATPASGPDVPGPSLGGVRVLVVDDDAPTRRAIAASLEVCGAGAMTAASVAEAWAAVREWRPHTLVSDIAMPGEDGYELIRRIRASEALSEASGASEGGSRTRAIALTAYASDEDRRRALAGGFDLYLAKPVEPQRLVRAVATVARGIGSRK